MDTTTKRFTVIALLILAVAAFLVYAANLRNCFVDIDAMPEIVANPSITDASFQGAVNLITRPTLFGFYTPVKDLTYLLIYVLSGKKMLPFPLHLSSNLLHVAVVICCYFFLVRLTRIPRYAFLVSLLFAVHPCHSQPINGIACRVHLFVALFALLSLLAYMRYRPLYGAEENTTSKGRRIFYVLSLLSFALGLLSWPIILPFPLVIFAYDVFVCSSPEKLQARLHAGLIRLLPFILLQVVYLTVVFRLFPTNSSTSFIGNYYPFSDFYRIIGIFFEYLRGATAPIHTEIGGAIPLPPYTEIGFYVVRLALITVFFLAALLLCRRQRWLVVGLSLFMVMTAPGLLFINPDTPFVFRYLYLPSLGIFMLLMYPVEQLLEACRGKQAVTGIIVVSIATLLAVFSVQTWQRSKVWYDSQSLWQSHLTADERSQALGYFRLGKIEEHAGNRREAVQMYRQSLCRVEALPGDSDYWYKLRLQRIVYLSLIECSGELRDDAAVHYYCNEWRRMEPLNAYPLYCQAAYYAQTGRLAEAKEELRWATAISAGIPEVFQERLRTIALSL